jgi:IclR family transcriptional regulator, pca regulon regulatory protein
VRPSAHSGSSLFVGSVEKAFEILRVLGAAPMPLRLSAVARVTGMGKSAVQRFLHTLARLELISQDRQSKAYAITPRILDLANSYLGADGLREKATPFLRAVNLETEETVNLTLLDRLSILYLLRYRGFHEISVDLSIGSKLPAFCTAPGKVMLAFLEDAESRSILEKSSMKRYTTHTIVDLSRIVASFGDIRRKGFYISNQEAFLGDVSVAAPVFNSAGRVVAAVNIAVSTSRWTVDSVHEQLMPVAVRTARGLSRALGHVESPRP